MNETFKIFLCCYCMTFSVLHCIVSNSRKWFWPSGGTIPEMALEGLRKTSVSVASFYTKI